MNHDLTTPSTPQQQGEIILYQPDETVRLEVRLKDDTVWLTQQQMAELFGRERSVIAKHIGNCFREGELTAEEVCAKFAQTTVHGAIAGKVQVHEVTFYNLDVIISVGYRVKSVNGTKFRQWATRILKSYLLQGAAIHQRLLYVKEEIDLHLKRHDRQLETLQSQVDFLVKTNRLPQQGVFCNGQVFTARLFVEDLIIDDDLWHCGASFKDLGRRLFAIDRLNIDKNVILGQL